MFDTSIRIFCLCSYLKWKPTPAPHWAGNQSPSLLCVNMTSSRQLKHLLISLRGRTRDGGGGCQRQTPCRGSWNIDEVDEQLAFSSQGQKEGGMCFWNFCAFLSIPPPFLSANPHPQLTEMCVCVGRGGTRTIEGTADWLHHISGRRRTRWRPGVYKHTVFSLFQVFCSSAHFGFQNKGLA